MARIGPNLQLTVEETRDAAVFHNVGLALQHVKPMQDELEEVEARLKRIEAAYEKPEFTEEERIRIGFAIQHHKENIERLKVLIKQAKANHSKMTIEKD